MLIQWYYCPLKTVADHRSLVVYDKSSLKRCFVSLQEKGMGSSKDILYVFGNDLMEIAIKSKTFAE